MKSHEWWKNRRRTQRTRTSALPHYPAGSPTYFIGEQKANIIHCNFSQGANPLESALPGGLIPSNELGVDRLGEGGRDGALVEAHRIGQASKPIPVVILVFCLDRKLAIRL